jgi:hypothetical protein
MPDMTATAPLPDIAPEPETTARDPALSPVGEDAAQVAVERVVFRSTLAGMGIGALICAVLWIGIVVVALVGKDEPLGPMLVVGAACGMFAGLFLGGWAGSLVGAAKLEHHEHRTLPGR